MPTRTPKQKPASGAPRMAVVIFIPAGGPPRLEAAHPFGLEAMQRLVGGRVAKIEFGADVDLWVHDDARLEARPGNVVATVLASRYGTPAGLIVGDAFLARTDAAGRTLPFPDAAATKRWLDAASAVYEELMAPQADVLGEFDAATQAHRSVK